MIKCYRIRYCDPDGREVPVCEASLYRVYLGEQHVRDFPLLSAANTWIKAQNKEGGAALAEMLGYAAYKDLMETVRLHAKGGAA
jgi:hypothetical protein